MKPTLIRKAIGGASALLGIYWVWMVIDPFIRRSFGNGHEFDNWFTLTIVPIMLVPGVLAAIFGIRLFRSMSLDSLKWVMGVFVIIGSFWLSATFERIFPNLLPERIASSAFLFTSCLIALPVYLVGLRFILPHLGQRRPRSSALIGRGGLMLVAWALWMLLSAIFHEYSPLKEGYTHFPEEPWGMLGIFVPIIVAYGAYRIAVSRLLATNAEQDEGSRAKPGA